MSIARYFQLRAELAAVRSRQLDTLEEDRLLGEMDDEWWSLTDAEQREIRSRLASGSPPDGSSEGGTSRLTGTGR